MVDTAVGSTIKRNWSDNLLLQLNQSEGAVSEINKGSWSVGNKMGAKVCVVCGQWTFRVFS